MAYESMKLSGSSHGCSGLSIAVDRARARVSYYDFFHSWWDNYRCV